MTALNGNPINGLAGKPVQPPPFPWRTIAGIMATLALILSTQQLLVFLSIHWYGWFRLVEPNTVIYTAELITAIALTAMTALILLMTLVGGKR